MLNISFWIAIKCNGTPLIGENGDVSVTAMESDADESATNETSKVSVDDDGRRIVDQPSVDALREAFVSSVCRFLTFFLCFSPLCPFSPPLL